MKLKYYYLAILFVSFSLSNYAQNKVGTVNINAILSKMPELKTAQEELKVYTDKLAADYAEKIKVLEKKVEDYKAKSSTYSEVMKKTKQDEIIGLEQDVANFQKNGTTMTQLKQDELLRPLYTKISDMVSVVSKEQKFSQVLTTDGNEFAYIDESFDITKSVIQKLGIEE